MLELVPGCSLEYVRDALREASRATDQALGGTYAQDRFNDYLMWTANQVARLRVAISATDLDRLITTPRYKSLFGRSFIDIGPAASEIVQDELMSRRDALDAELASFEQDMGKWGNGRAVAVVPDTSVFLEHGDEFATLPWHPLVNERSNVMILLVVTMQVVRELDRRKLNPDNSARGKLLRSRARAALREIERLFPWNDAQEDHTSNHDEAIKSHVFTTLLTDDLQHVPLADPDAEIISRAVAVKPYAGDATLVSYDLAQTFRARAADLESVRLTYGWEDSEQDDGATV